MLLDFLQPGVLSETNGDLDYLAVLEQFGDTTDPFAHVEALRSFGVQCDFITNGSFALLEQQIDKGIPVPVGWLHQGDLRHEGPSGGGHWSVVTGLDNGDLVVCDPFGEADLLTGGYLEIGEMLVTKCSITAINSGADGDRRLRFWLDDSGQLKIHAANKERHQESTGNTID